MVVLGLGILSMLHTMCGCTLAVSYVVQNMIQGRLCLHEQHRTRSWQGGKEIDCLIEILTHRVGNRHGKLQLWGLNRLQQESRLCSWGQSAVLLPLAGRDGWHRNKWFLLPKINKQEEIMEVTSFWLSVCKWDLSQAVGFRPQKILELWWTHLCSWQIWKVFLPAWSSVRRWSCHFSGDRTEVSRPP